jgi:hypothetical protein
LRSSVFFLSFSSTEISPSQVQVRASNFLKYEEMRFNMARRKEMENWKRGLLAGAAGLSVIFLLKRNRTGALLFGGVTLATLASEYPEKFAEIRSNLPDYVERGAAFLDTVTRAGERLAEVAGSRGAAWYESLLRA